jgi:hypothetical protein
MEPWIINLPVGMAGSASVNCTELVMKIKYILCAKACANALLFFILLINQTGCGPSNRDKGENKTTNKSKTGNNKENKKNDDLQINNFNKINKSDFEIAKDSNEISFDRVSAALRLDKNKGEILKKLLLGRIQNKYTKLEFDDTFILGEIGDEETAKELEKLCLEAIDGKFDVPGKIDAARFGAIEKIRKRIRINQNEKEN